MKTEVSPHPLVGRGDSLRVLEEARDAGRGSLILGVHGIGKTALATAAAATSASFHVVSIHGTEVSRRTSYGALAWLLSQLSGDLPATPPMHPLLVFRKISALLRQNAGDRPVLLLVDNAQYLDEGTALVISQLVRAREVTLIATATDLPSAPAEVFSLWSDGLLQRIDLEPLDLRQTKLLMEQVLAGPVSLRAAAAMWRATEGNPQFILLMVDEQVAAGTLVDAGTAWVAAGPYVRSGAIAEVVEAELARMTTQERRIVEILSFIGTLNLTAILELADAEALDSLQEKGVLTLSTAAVPMVRVKSTTLAAVVTGSVPLGRSRELWEEVTARLDVGERIDAAALPGYVAWTLACEADPPAAMVQEAVRLANADGDHSRALTYARSVPDASRSPELVAEEVRALMALGENHEALAVLERFERSGTALPDGSRAALQLQKAALLRSMPTAAKAPEAGFGAHLDIAGGSLRTAQAESVILAEADLHLAEGDYKRTLEPLLGLVSAPGTAPDVRARATAMAAEALAVTGQAARGMQLLEGVTGLMQVPMGAGEQAVLLTRVFYAYFAAGEFQRAIGLLAELDSGGLRWSYRGSAGELAAGLIRAASGQADEALDVLLPGISQLRYRDPENVMPLAAALTAYAYRLRGDTETAMSYVSMAPRFRHRPYWYPEQITAYFKAVASQAGTPEVLQRRLRELADRALEKSNPAFALSCLAAAASLGDRSAAGQLHEVASTATGRWAEALADYGAGLVSQDAQALLRTAGAAAELGHPLFSYRTAVQIRTAGAAATGRRVARAALALENQAYRKLRRENSLERKVEQLSAFEAELVRLAAGDMNRNDIAAELSLSPRTIDWHLGKIFDKLHVSGRSELKEALG